MTPAGRNRPLVLVVDDEEDIRLVVTARLEAAGYAVETAANGLEGLNLARRLRPDIILLDLMLPGLDGYSVCAMLKRDQQFGSIPIVMLSARSQARDVETGLKLGADAYLTKPFAGAELVAKVRELVGPQPGEPAEDHPQITQTGTSRPEAGRVVMKDA